LVCTDKSPDVFLTTQQTGSLPNVLNYQGNIFSGH
jgi:hypothetical protein